MKTFVSPSVLLALSLTVAVPAFGDAYSLNVVGYINRPFVAGDNLLANQLGNGAGELINDIFTNNVPDGTTLTKWNSATSQFLTPSTFSASSQSWSINYSLTYGEGAVVHTGTGFTSTFVGNVYSGWSDPGGLVWNPNYANGLYLLSCPVPFGNATFQQVVGRDPQDGEWVKTLNEATQLYTVTTYHSDTGWDYGAPSLGVVQAAWFDLGPVIVPEPSVVALGALGVLTVARLRRRLG